MGAKSCPRCSSDLTRVEHEKVVLQACQGCGGLFVGGQDLARLARRKPTALDALEGRAKPSGTRPRRARRGTRRRPHCGQAMQAYRLPVCPEVRLDRCPTYSGTWADDGELGAIGDHLERGHEVIAAYAGRYAHVLTGMEVEGEVRRQRWAAVAGVCGLLDWRPIAEEGPSPQLRDQT